MKIGEKRGFNVHGIAFCIHRETGRRLTVEIGGENILNKDGENSPYITILKIKPAMRPALQYLYDITGNLLTCSDSYGGKGLKISKMRGVEAEHIFVIEMPRSFLKDWFLGYENNVETLAKDLEKLIIEAEPHVKNVLGESVAELEKQQQQVMKLTAEYAQRTFYQKVVRAAGGLNNEGPVSGHYL